MSSHLKTVPAYPNRLINKISHLSCAVGLGSLPSPLHSQTNDFDSNLKLILFFFYINSPFQSHNHPVKWGKSTNNHILQMQQNP